MPLSHHLVSSQEICTAHDFQRCVMQTTLSLPQNISTIFWLVCLIFISFEDLEDLSNGEDTGCLCDRRETKSLKKVIVFSAFTLLGYKSATASACNCMEEWDRYEGTSVSEQVGPCPKPDIYLLPRRRVLYLIYHQDECHWKTSSCHW